MSGNTKNTDLASLVVDISLLTPQQKKAYCLQWEGSGLNKSTFCKQQGLPVNKFYVWCQQYLSRKAVKANEWSEVIVKRQEASMLPSSMTTVEITLPNDLSVRVALSERKTISFIQELIDATTIIR